MTDFSCGLILPKISQQPARQPVAGRLRIHAQNEAHLGVSGLQCVAPTVHKFAVCMAGPPRRAPRRARARARARGAPIDRDAACDDGGGRRSRAINSPQPSFA
jgi:hypothetical protein